MPGFLAYIIPVDSGNRPDQGLPSPQPPGYPSHPWVPPTGRPDQGLPGRPDQGLPPYPDQGLPGGGRPPGFWGGINPHPDQGLPGGGQGGGNPHPEHPIPPQIWIGPVLPPGAEEPSPEEIKWHSAWSSETGWMTVGIPTGEAPTPSAQSQPK
jgi:hypothetical protein